jgi:hypothetical protein
MTHSVKSERFGLYGCSIFLHAFPCPYLYILYLIKAVTLIKLYKFFHVERNWRRWRRRVRGAGARWRVIFSIVVQIFRLQDLTYRQVQDGEIFSIVA